MKVPAGAEGPLPVEATLRCRAAPQEALDALIGKERFPPRTVDTASARAAVPVPR